MTLKEQLEKAEAELADLKPKAEAAEGLQTQLNTAKADLSAAEKARDAEKARADKAETDLKAATDRAQKAEQDAKDAQAKADGLEAAAKTTDEKAREQLSGVGLNRQAKADGVITGTSEDIAAVAECFTDPKTSMSDKAALLRKHGAALSAYAGSLPNRG